jgi:hypothetical protein
MINFVHEIAKYERGDFAIAAKRGKHEYTIVPELSAALNLWWYPIEGVQIKVGYELAAFFNTIASPEPVSFNFGSPTPEWERTFRWFDGFNVGIGLIF